MPHAQRRYASLLERHQHGHGLYYPRTDVQIGDVVYFDDDSHSHKLFNALQPDENVGLAYQMFADCRREFASRLLTGLRSLLTRRVTQFGRTNIYSLPSCPAKLTCF
jgi:hypothetical protein